MSKEKNYKNIHKLVKALKRCGYTVDEWWLATWYNPKDKHYHYGIEINILDAYDVDGNEISLIFNKNGEHIEHTYEA